MPRSKVAVGAGIATLGALAAIASRPMARELEWNGQREMEKGVKRLEPWLALAWLVMAGLMSWSYFAEPRVDPHAPGGTPHYVNIQGELWPWLIVSLAELGFVFLLLRGWNEAWKRFLVVVGGGSLVLWTLASAVITVGSHAGSVMTVHMIWLLVLTPVPFVAMVTRGVSAVR